MVVVLVSRKQSLVTLVSLFVLAFFWLLDSQVRVHAAEQSIGDDDFEDAGESLAVTRSDEEAAAAGSPMYTNAANRNTRDAIISTSPSHPRHTLHDDEGPRMGILRRNKNKKLQAAAGHAEQGASVFAVKVAPNLDLTKTGDLSSFSNPDRSGDPHSSVAGGQKGIPMDEWLRENSRRDLEYRKRLGYDIDSIIRGGGISALQKDPIQIVALHNQEIEKEAARAREEKHQANTADGTDSASSVENKFHRIAFSSSESNYGKPIYAENGQDAVTRDTRGDFGGRSKGSYAGATMMMNQEATDEKGQWLEQVTKERRRDAEATIRRGDDESQHAPEKENGEVAQCCRGVSPKYAGLRTLAEINAASTGSVRPKSETEDENSKPSSTAVPATSKSEDNNNENKNSHKLEGVVREAWLRSPPAINNGGDNDEDSLPIWRAGEAEPKTKHSCKAEGKEQVTSSAHHQEAKMLGTPLFSSESGTRQIMAASGNNAETTTAGILHEATPPPPPAPLPPPAETDLPPLQPHQKRMFLKGERTKRTKEAQEEILDGSIRVKRVRNSQNITASDRETDDEELAIATASTIVKRYSSEEPTEKEQQKTETTIVRMETLPSSSNDKEISPHLQESLSLGGDRTYEEESPSSHHLPVRGEKESSASANPTTELPLLVRNLKKEKFLFELAQKGEIDSLLLRGNTERTSDEDDGSQGEDSSTKSSSRNPQKRNGIGVADQTQRRDRKLREEAAGKLRKILQEFDDELLRNLTAKQRARNEFERKRQREREAAREKHNDKGNDDNRESRAQSLGEALSKSIELGKEKNAIERKRRDDEFMKEVMGFAGEPQLSTESEEGAKEKQKPETMSRKTTTTLELLPLGKPLTPYEKRQVEGRQMRQSERLAKLLLDTTTTTVTIRSQENDGGNENDCGGCRRRDSSELKGEKMSDQGVDEKENILPNTILGDGILTVRTVGHGDNAIAFNQGTSASKERNGKGRRRVGLKNKNTHSPGKSNVQSDTKAVVGDVVLVKISMWREVLEQKKGKTTTNTYLKHIVSGLRSFQIGSYCSGLLGESSAIKRNAEDDHDDKNNNNNNNNNNNGEPCHYSYYVPTPASVGSNFLPQNRHNTVRAVHEGIVGAKEGEIREIIVSSWTGTGNLSRSPFSIIQSSSLLFGPRGNKRLGFQPFFPLNPNCHHHHGHGNNRETFSQSNGALDISSTKNIIINATLLKIFSKNSGAELGDSNIENRQTRFSSSSSSSAVDDRIFTKAIEDYLFQISKTQTASTSSSFYYSLSSSSRSPSLLFSTHVGECIEGTPSMYSVFDSQGTMALAYVQHVGKVLRAIDDRASHAIANSGVVTATDPTSTTNPLSSQQHDVMNLSRIVLASPPIPSYHNTFSKSLWDTYDLTNYIFGGGSHFPLFNSRSISAPSQSEGLTAKTAHVASPTAHSGTFPPDKMASSSFSVMVTVEPALILLVRGARSETQREALRRANALVLTSSLRQPARAAGDGLETSSATGTEQHLPLLSYFDEIVALYVNKTIRRGQLAEMKKRFRRGGGENPESNHGVKNNNNEEIVGEEPLLRSTFPREFDDPRLSQIERQRYRRQASEKKLREMIRKSTENLVREKLGRFLPSASSSALISRNIEEPKSDDDQLKRIIEERIAYQLKTMGLDQSHDDQTTTADTKRNERNLPRFSAIPPPPVLSLTGTFEESSQDSENAEIFIDVSRELEKMDGGADQKKKAITNARSSKQQSKDKNNKATVRRALDDFLATREQLLNGIYRSVRVGSAPLSSSEVGTSKDERCADDHRVDRVGCFSTDGSSSNSGEAAIAKDILLDSFVSLPIGVTLDTHLDPLSDRILTNLSAFFSSEEDGDDDVDADDKYNSGGDDHNTNRRRQVQAERAASPSLFEISNIDALYNVGSGSRMRMKRALYAHAFGVTNLTQIDPTTQSKESKGEKRDSANYKDKDGADDDDDDVDFEAIEAKKSEPRHLVLIKVTVVSNGRQPSRKAVYSPLVPHSRANSVGEGDSSDITTTAFLLLFELENIGRISRTTLDYLYLLQDIQKISSDLAAAMAEPESFLPSTNPQTEADEKNEAATARLSSTKVTTKADGLVSIFNWIASNPQLDYFSIVHEATLAGIYQLDHKNQENANEKGGHHRDSTKEHVDKSKSQGKRETPDDGTKTDVLAEAEAAQQQAIWLTQAREGPLSFLVDTLPQACDDIIRQWCTTYYFEGSGKEGIVEDRYTTTTTTTAASYFGCRNNHQNEEEEEVHYGRMVPTRQSLIARTMSPLSPSVDLILGEGNVDSRQTTAAASSSSSLSDRSLGEGEHVRALRSLQCPRIYQTVVKKLFAVDRCESSPNRGDKPEEIEKVGSARVLDTIAYLEGLINLPLGGDAPRTDDRQISQHNVDPAMADRVRSILSLCSRSLV